MKKNTLFYDVTKTYEENYTKGPFGLFRTGLTLPSLTAHSTFFGYPVNISFGIPAGPLVNGAFVNGAQACGFSINTYKTVRSRSFPCHPFPNVIKVTASSTDIHPGDTVLGDLAIETIDIKTDGITNSFGVPSQDPKEWQKDIKACVQSMKPGSVVIASFMGTKEAEMTRDQYIADFCHTHTLIKATDSPILEVNFSCPNIGNEGLVCNDVEISTNILEELHAQKGNVPLLVKIGYFSPSQQSQLEQLLTAIHRFADGVVAINTVPAQVVDPQGKQLLPGSQVRMTSGTCGATIRWAGLQMIERIVSYKQKQNWKDFVIVGVGGVITPQDYLLYKQLGVDCVQSATGSMWKPYLAQEIAEFLLQEGTL